MPLLIGFGWLLAGLVAGLVVAGLAASAPRLVAGHPRSLAQLHLSMLVTALAIVAAGVGLLWLVVELLGYQAELLVLAGIVTGVMLVQWLVSPYVINAIYRVRPAGPELAWLASELERMARQAGFSRPPRLVVAEVSAPNAFAYGNPITGYYVAVTRGLLNLLPRDELLAVLGHELGHIRHRDVQYILALSLLPSIAYFAGRVLMELWLWGYRGDRERNAGPLLYLAVGALLVAASVVLHFLVRHFNRLREYYADAHSAIVLGAVRPLQRALTRIYLAYRRSPHLVEQLRALSAAEMLFIVNPLVSIDEAVEAVKREEVSPLEELFSTHPPIPKRLRFLDELATAINPGRP